jgi:transcriptional repressor NrdR
MRCPKCREKETRVTDSRMSQEGDNVRRRRECTACGFRFTTYERLEVTLPMVIKKDGRREPYERDKVISGMQRATQKRDISVDDLEAIADRLEQAMQERGDREVPSSWIGEYVMEALRGMDDVAYVRFASVYREFQDIGEFMSALATIRRGRRGDGK